MPLVVAARPSLPGVARQAACANAGQRPTTAGRGGERPL